MPSPVSSNNQGSANAGALMVTSCTLPGMPDEIIDDLISHNPDSALVLRVVSREFKRISDEFLQRNASEIFEWASRARSPLYRLICSSFVNFRRVFGDHPGHMNAQFHLSIPGTIRSLGVPAAECPDKILVLQEICQFDERAQNVEDANLQRIWGPIRRTILATNGLPGGPPADNALPQEIRTWMHANGAVLQGITLLRLNDLQLTCVPKEIGLFTGLQRLGLGNNQLRSLPEGIFQRLVQLRELGLGNNQLRSLPEGIFQGLVQLQRLGLGNNRLGFLPEGLFQGLVQLQGLGLKNNQLVSLPERLFQGLIQLQRLGLHNNQLVSLPEGLFQGLVQLQKLGLHNNQLLSLPEGIFQGLVQLQKLSLTKNQLSSLPEGLFQGLVQLQRLSFFHNQLSSLPERLFQGLIQLQKLSLHANRLVFLPKGLLQGLVQLQALSLHANRLVSLPKRLFQGLAALQTLQLHTNLLVSLPERLFQELVRLQMLELGDNRLASLPERLFHGMAALQKLSLDTNQLDSLPEEFFHELAGLQGLTLYGNPRLFVSYNDLPVPKNGIAVNNIAFREVMHQFFNYECKSPFAYLYQFAARGGSLDAVKELFQLLPDNIKNAISYTVSMEAGRQDIHGAAQWGEKHAFDDMQIFRRALRRLVRNSFDAMGQDRKNAVYGHVFHLAQEERGAEAVNFDVANWGEVHAFDNILRLIDAMNRL